jgi:hypothetical protein
VEKGLVVQRGYVRGLAVVSVQSDYLVEIILQHVQCMCLLAFSGKAHWVELDERDIHAERKGLDGLRTLCTEHSSLHHVWEDCTTVCGLETDATNYKYDSG